MLGSKEVLMGGRGKFDGWRRENDRHSFIRKPDFLGAITIKGGL